MLIRARARHGVVAFCLLLPLILAACSDTTITATPSTGAPATAAATSTPVVATCATLLPGAGTASAGSHFADVSFPAGMVTTSITTHSDSAGLYAIYLFNACSPSTTASAVSSFFASQLPASGWHQATTYPFNGGYLAACGDPYCWAKDTYPRYVGLENVAAASGGNVTYRIRLAVPPLPLPDCSGIMPPGIPLNAFISNIEGVPVPLFTRPGPGDGYDNGTIGHSYTPMCSPGTTASINAWEISTLEALGYVHGSLPCESATGYVKSNKLVQWAFPSSSPLSWAMTIDDCG